MAARLYFLVVELGTVVPLPIPRLLKALVMAFATAIP
jgi:hypothetical protein